MKNTCDRPPTNAEIFYKIFHEWLDFCWKLIKLIFKSKQHSTVFIFAISFAILFVSAKIDLKDCVNGVKYLLTFL
jgi:hypothetical protein